MPQCCAVPMCSNKIGGHRFPRDKIRLEQWLVAIRRDNYTPTINSIVCKYHFTKDDYEKPKESVMQHHRLSLKKNAVPSIFSWNDPNYLETYSKRRGKKLHRLDDISTGAGVENVTMECRACLCQIQGVSFCVDLLSAWNPPWPGMGLSVAEDLSKLTGIQINPSDEYSKICSLCCSRLQDAASFTQIVQNSDIALRNRLTGSSDDTPEWPKPIQVDKNISNDEVHVMETEIKQEVLTEEEDNMSDNCETKDGELDALDIKIEPEEITQSDLQFHISSPKSLLPQRNLTPEDQSSILNGETVNTELLYPEVSVKEELTSDEETDLEDNPDLDKDCMLCTMTFQTLKGLKAHVLAVHSYESVVKPPKSHGNGSFECPICNNNFTSEYHLKQHEEDHVSPAQFVDDSELAAHERSCSEEVATLDDVRRIAGHRGTKTLELFNLQIPISRIKHLKMNENALSVKQEQRAKKNRKQKKKNNGHKDENDILRNILNNNVTSVIVNLKLPTDSLKIPKKELVDDKSIIPKLEPLDYFENIIPKKEQLEYHETPNQILQTNPTGAPFDNITLMSPLRGIPISQAKVTSLPIDESKLNLAKYLRKLKRKRRKRKLLNPLQKKAKLIAQQDKTTHQVTETERKISQLKRAGIDYAITDGKVIPTKKVDNLFYCRKKCAIIIPQEFRQRFFDYYWTLSYKSQKKLIPELIRCKLLTSDALKPCQRDRKCTFSYCLKLDGECYDICKGCFVQTLGISSTLNTICKKILRAKLETSDLRTEL